MFFVSSLRPLFNQYIIRLIFKHVIDTLQMYKKVVKSLTQKAQFQGLSRFARLEWKAPDYSEYIVLYVIYVYYV